MSQNVYRKVSLYDVFISYSSKDKSVTDAMCHFLEENKIRCWFAPRDILPGQEYADVIEHAINSVKVFILVCSKDSLQSQWVHRETNLAVTDGKIIIPFKIENCSLEGTGMKLYLNDRHWIDAVPYPNEAFGDLADAITSILGTKTEPDLSDEPPKSRKQDSVDDLVDNAVSKFLDQADPDLVKSFLKAKTNARWGVMVVAATSLVFIIGFNFFSTIHCFKYIYCYFYLFFFPISLLYTIVFEIKSYYYSRQLKFPFEIKYSVLKKKFRKRYPTPVKSPPRS